MSEKAEVLRKGAQFLQAALAPHGFNFEMRGRAVVREARSRGVNLCAGTAALSFTSATR